jgi:hypothetical protein
MSKVPTELEHGRLIKVTITDVCFVLTASVPLKTAVDFSALCDGY